MTLKDVVSDLQNPSNHERTICARRPWTADSEVILATQDGQGRIPLEFPPNGFDYLLEVAVAIEVLEVFGQRPATLEERVDCLIFYAENDAFPAWVHES